MAETPSYVARQRPEATGSGPRLGNINPVGDAMKQAGAQISQLGGQLQARADQMRQIDQANELATRKIQLMDGSRQVRVSLGSLRGGDALGVTEKARSIFEKEILPGVLKGVSPELAPQVRMAAAQEQDQILIHFAGYEAKQRDEHTKTVTEAFEGLTLASATESFSGDPGTIVAARGEILKHRVAVTHPGYTPGEDPDKDALFAEEAQGHSREVTDKLVDGLWRSYLSRDPAEAVKKWNKDRDVYERLLEPGKFSTLNNTMKEHGGAIAAWNVSEVALAESGGDPSAAALSLNINAGKFLAEIPDEEKARVFQTAFNSLQSRAQLFDKVKAERKEAEQLRVLVAIADTADPAEQVRIAEQNKAALGRLYPALKESQRVAINDQAHSELITDGILAAQRGELKSPGDVTRYLSGTKHTAADIVYLTNIAKGIQADRGNQINQVEAAVARFKARYNPAKTKIGKSVGYFQNKLTAEFQAAGVTSVYDPRILGIGDEIIKNVQDKNGFFGKEWEPYLKGEDVPPAQKKPMGKILPAKEYGNNTAGLKKWMAGQVPK